MSEMELKPMFEMTTDGYEGARAFLKAMGKWEESKEQDGYTIVAVANHYLDNRPTEDALRKRVAELEQQLAETETYPGIAADMLRLQKRVGELETGIKSIDGRVYRSFKRGNCEMLFVHQELEALTPPATEQKGM